MSLTTVSRARAQCGVSVMEALVAIVVAALGIMGILGMQMRTFTDAHTSVRRAQAVRLIEDLGERLAANPNAYQNLAHYTTGWGSTPGGAPNCAAAACAHDGLARYDIQQWKQAVTRWLPEGDAQVFIAQDEAAAAHGPNRRQLGVMIAWRENEADDSADYRDPINAAAGAGSAAACPGNKTCHLQFIPLLARCAVHGSGSRFYCSDSSHW